MRRSCVGVGLALAACVGALRGAPSLERIEALFHPWLAEQVAMSPDGRYVAYTRQQGTNLTIEILELERMSRKARIVADDAREVLHSKDKEPARLRFLQWASPTRLVFAPTVETIAPSVRRLPGVPGEPPPPPLEPTVIAPVMAVDDTGKNPRTLVDADTFGVEVGTLMHSRLRMRAPQVIGFASGDRDHVLVRVQGIAARFPSPAAMEAGEPPRPPTPAEVFRVNVHTGKFESVHTEMMESFEVFYFDRTGKTRIAVEREGALRRPYLFQPANSERWRKLPEAAGAPVLRSFWRAPETYYGERAIPLAMDYDPNVLIYASNVGRDTFGVYGLNLATLQPTGLAVEHPGRDFASLATTGGTGTAIFDFWKQRLVGVRAQGMPPLRVWLDPELAAAQREVELKFPRRSVEIVDWDEGRRKFLARVTGGSEPGRLFLWQKEGAMLVELLRRAPWLPNAELHASRFIEFPAPDGTMLSAHLTLPRKPRINPPPLAICFAGGLPPMPHEEFDAEAQVLADMGFVVARLNQRGVLGHGTKRRDAARGEFARAAAADAVATIGAVAQQQAIDRKRVVVMGAGFAGYLAVWAAQVESEAFRCVVAVEPPLSLVAWVQPPADFGAGPPSFRQEVERMYLEAGKAKLHELSAFDAGKMNAAVFILNRGHRADAVAAGVAQLRGQLKRRGLSHEVVEIGDDYVLGLPGARLKAYRALEEFFNLNLYNPNVKIGPTRVVR